jgi:general secretion pathway protein D
MTRRSPLPPSIASVSRRGRPAFRGILCGLIAWGLLGEGPRVAAQAPTADGAPQASSPSPAEPPLPRPTGGAIAIDFKDVDLPVLVKFFSELTRKNFVIDEKVKGKVTIFSPSKLSIDAAYRVFLSVLELKGFAAVPAGVIQIIPVAEVSPDRAVEVYPLANATAEEMVKVLNVVVARPGQTGPSPPESARPASSRARCRSWPTNRPTPS